MQQQTFLLPSQAPFSAQKTFTCGQCFRWAPQPDGSYIGLVRGIPAQVWTEHDQLAICTSVNSLAMWTDYFDCDTDYTAISRSFAIDDFTTKAAAFGRGIRILKQEPWEALCTFILSQCNNIPRITGLVRRLCEQLGTPISFKDQTLYTFPEPEALAQCTLSDLQVLRAGYRAPYLLAAAQAMQSGELDFAVLNSLSTAEARKSIMKLRGVGRKVADCFLLFGLHKLDAFPVDTWMKKAAIYYDGDMLPFMDSPYAGVYQQYFFFYTREHKLG